MFFVTLGVIFFILILIGLYLYIADPWGIKPFLSSMSSDTVMVDETGEVDSHPMLNESQEKALETVGINPAELPSEITSEQEACFIEVLGEARVAEIVAGDSPTALEIIKAKACI